MIALLTAFAYWLIPTVRPGLRQWTLVVFSVGFIFAVAPYAIFLAVFSTAVAVASSHYWGRFECNAGIAIGFCVLAALPLICLRLLLFEFG